MKSCCLCGSEGGPAIVRRWYNLREPCCRDCAKLYRQKRIEVYQGSAGCLALTSYPGATRCRIVLFERNINGKTDYAMPRLAPAGDFDSPEQNRAASPMPHVTSPNLFPDDEEEDSPIAEEDNDDYFEDTSLGVNCAATDFNTGASDNLDRNGTKPGTISGTMSEINKLKGVMTSTLKAHQAELDKRRGELREKDKIICDMQKKIEVNKASHLAKVNEMSAQLRDLSKKSELVTEEANDLKQETANKEENIAQLRNFINRVRAIQETGKHAAHEVAQVIDSFERNFAVFGREVIKILGE